ncbi:uncharacterized protein BDV17DRAFT_124059 [Aspergillus undulatus]|uniref:uncharacterized protein n=1 Tax=Aspergillus undulatus TaxID=1810928 RepID=UPI003CCC9E55
MLNSFLSPQEQDYEILSQPPSSSDIYDEESRQEQDTSRPSRLKPSARCIYTLYTLGFMLSLAAAFTTGALFTLYISSHDDTYTVSKASLSNIAPFITLPQISGQIIHNSPFSKEPPQGPGAGNISEPIWDALVPNGLGYFRNSTSANVVIPTIMHQLHCLYLLRRAYYSDPDELQRFDFGRNRSVHVAHCFDYLVQTIVCSADSTLEPAVDHEHGFLGSGFWRRCWSFEALKGIVQEKRVFDAEGFLAWGIGEEGRVHIG